MKTKYRTSFIKDKGYKGFSTRYFAKARNHSKKFTIKNNSQWSMKGSLDFVFMNQIKQKNSRKHETK